jgi:hypothetical protein
MTMRAIESEADLDVDLTVSCSSAPASQSARPRRKARFVNYSSYASDTEALTEQFCRAVTPLPVILRLKKALILLTARAQEHVRDQASRIFSLF